MATKMYLFLVYDYWLNLPHKIKSPFHKWFFWKTCDQLCKTLSHQSSYSLACITRFIVIIRISVHSWPPISNIGQYFPLCDFNCSSLITIYAFIVVKHLWSLLSWPILYNSPFFNMKGYVILTDFCFYYIDNVPSICPFFITLFSQEESLYFSCQFSDICHNSSKVFNETFLKLCHTIEYLNMLWILKWWHVYYCLYFLWIWLFPFFGNNKTQNHSWKYNECTFVWIQTKCHIFYTFENILWVFANDYPCHYLGQSFALLVCNNPIDCCLKL